MKLGDILRTPGTHVWTFTRETGVKDLAEAGRRVQAYLQQKQFLELGASVETEGRVLVNPKPPYASEPALVITVKHKRRAS